MSNLSLEVREIIKKQNWLVLSTVDENNHPHSSVVVYQSNGKTIICQTGSDTLKARNIRKNKSVAVTIPFRKGFLHKLIPAPPAELHFSSEAEIKEFDNKEAREIYEKYLKYDNVGPSEVEKVWIKITLPNIISTYGVGVRLFKMRKPEEALNMVKFED
jgi:hypothetical protein